MASAAVYGGQPVSANLAINSLTITFPPEDPDATPNIAATENPVSVGVVVKGAGVISQLTVEAGGDLVSGSDRIPIDQVTWTADGNGFIPGVMNKSLPQLVGQWSGKTSTTGHFRFWLRNSWSYAVGDYSQSLVYTLIAY